MIKCTTGEVKEMVKNCIQLPPKERYETAKQMMPQSYRDSQRVIAAFCKEIKQWPQIKPDVKAYRKFENLIVNDSVSSKEAAEQYIDKKTKKSRNAMYLSESKEKPVWFDCEITMHKLWRKSWTGQLPEVHGHGFEGQNQLPINEKVLLMEDLNPQWQLIDWKLLEQRMVIHR